MTDFERIVVDNIDKHRDEIISFAREVFAHPELGYREYKTSRLIKDKLESIGLVVQDGLAITGVKATHSYTPSGRNVCVMGELDSVVCPTHPDSDPITGNAHACGHHAQLATLLGVAYGLCDDRLKDYFTGKVTYLAVPAEECLDLTYRSSLIKEGKIEFISGKQQLIAEGAFGDIDMALMQHANAGDPEPCVYLKGSSLGFVRKDITFLGKAVHASTPEGGINALNAASLAILGMHTCRERYTEQDHIRVHGIITKGGEASNVVPAEVCMEGYVRGANVSAITKASTDVDNVCSGAATMVGATAIVKTDAGYLPLLQDDNLSDIYAEVATDYVKPEHTHYGVDMVGSTDAGDLSQLIPVLHTHVGGFNGTLHGADFSVADEETAYITSAKMLARTVAKLLANGGALADKVVAEYKPNYTTDGYLDYLRQASHTVIYNEK